MPEDFIKILFVFTVIYVNNQHLNLIWHVYRHDLKKTWRKDIIKIYGNEEFKQVRVRSDCDLAFPKPNFCFKLGNIGQKLVKKNGGRNFLRRLSHTLR